jgi:acyl phosphate:glycerol-3-phosphate acyltransferase
MSIFSLLAVPLGYIFGSFPSSYLMGRIYNVNLLKEGDGHISATAVFRRLGIIPFLIVLLFDVIKGMLAIYCAQLLTEYQLLILLTGLAAVIGHCWPVFIKFQGGLGATITYGILFFLVPVHFLIGGIIAIITLFVTGKSSISTIMLIVTISILLLVQYVFSPYPNGLLLVDYPIVLMLVQYLKRLQIEKSGKGGKYQNELLEDLKRIR